MLSITEIEPINQKLNPELALSLSLDDTKRMESPWLRSGFSLDTNTWKLILFYNGSLEEIQKEIPFSFIPLLGNFAILFIQEKIPEKTLQVFRGLMDVFLQICVICTNKCIPEVPGIFCKNIICGREAQSSQVLNEENRSGSGISLSKNVDLPQS